VCIPAGPLTEPAARPSLGTRSLAIAGGAFIFPRPAGMMAGECGQSGWLLAYWSKPVLFSAKARRDWVAPDLQPLPFDVQA
jgi:hypothetical protein